MTILTAYITGAEDTAREFGSAENRIRGRLRQKMAEITRNLRERAKSAAPQGPSGRLKRKFRSRTWNTDDVYYGQVSTLFYGRFVEEGVGPTTAEVTAYTRRSRSGDVRGGASGRKRIAMGVVFVKAHERRMQMTARPFLAPTLASMADSIMGQIMVAVGGQEG